MCNLPVTGKPVKLLLDILRQRFKFLPLLFLRLQTLAGARGEQPNQPVHQGEFLEHLPEPLQTGTVPLLLLQGFCLLPAYDKPVFRWQRHPVFGQEHGRLVNHPAVVGHCIQIALREAGKAFLIQPGLLEQDFGIRLRA